MKNKSFTLIELLVVIVIIGILASVIIVSVSSSIGKANFAKAQAFSNTVQNELLGDLVSEWTFDEGNAEDSWGNNDGAVIGATYVPRSSDECVYGGCYSFNGTNSYIDVGYNTSLIKASPERTLSAWIYVTGGENTFRAIVSPTTGSWVHFQINEQNRIGTYFYGPSVGINSVTLFNYNKWFHVLVLWDGTHAKIYVNGALDATSSASSGNSGSATSNIHIGNGYSNGRFFNGLIDDVRVYDAALSSAQIKQQYVAGLNSLLANGSISKQEYEQRLNNLALEK